MPNTSPHIGIVYSFYRCPQIDTVYSPTEEIGRQQHCALVPDPLGSPYNEKGVPRAVGAC